MTGSSNKLRGLFLAALMVLSVFAMGATFTGTVAAEHGNTHDDVLDSDDDRFWVGQEVLFEGNSANDYEIRDGDGQFESEVSADGAGHVLIDTDSLGEGQYQLYNVDGNTVEHDFSVSEQDLQVDGNQSEVRTGGLNNEVAFSVRSKRTTYGLTVSADGLDASDLEQIFSGAAQIDDTDTVQINLDNGDRTSMTGNFSGQDTGEYTFEFGTNDTSATSDVELDVTEPIEGSVSFQQTVITEQRGDDVALVIGMSGEAETANLTVGDDDDVNYEWEMEVRDTNGDGYANVTWNTADSHNSTNGGFTAGEGTSIDDRTDVNNVSTPVETGEYTMSAVFENQEDLGTIIIDERETTGLNTHTAPGGVDSDEALDHASDAEIGDTVATGSGLADWVIVSLEADGLGGYVGDDVSDLNDTANNGLSLTVFEADETVNINEDGVSFSIEDSSLWVPDEDNDEYYVGFRANKLTEQGAEVGDQFIVTFEVLAENNSVSDSDESVTATFELVEGFAEIDLEGDRLYLPANEGATVTGTSSWAPGTELSSTIRSPRGQEPFSQQNDSIVVNEDGTWNAGFDLADKPEGQEFEISLTHKNAGSQHSASGQIGELDASVTFSDQVAQDAGTLVYVDDVTLSDGGFVAIHEGSANGDIVGVSSYLEAGSHSDVRVRLDESVDDQVTLVAMAHKDTDDNEQFGFVPSGGDDDGPYTTDGSAITDSATVSISTPTPTDADPGTDTPTPTDADPGTDTPAETDEPEETDEPADTPGFGLVVALVALMAAALLAVRRDN